MIKVVKESSNLLEKVLLACLIFLAFGARIFAFTPPDEGMWLPMLVERLNYVDMQKMGLKLTPEEIYSINHASLKDAIVGLSSSSTPGGFFCSGSIVSDQGLLFTNHHCGYDVIQKHSSIEHDYLNDGFWAMSKEEELPNEELTATFFISMANVTDSIIPFLSDTMAESSRLAKVREISGRLKKAANPDGKFFINVKSFFAGNEYYLFVYKVYKDVRLVGAPPSSIGKFGGDTDNWMWPRQTGDFSIFRVYTAPDGSPAEYSKDNIPYTPAWYLPVCTSGYKLGDFAMVWGYPGSTDRYLSSYGVDFQLKEFDPNIIKLLGIKLDTWKEFMDANREVAIKYSSKYAGLANGWKYFIGQDKGLKRLNVFGEKQKIEQEFTNWAQADPARMEKYGKVLEHLDQDYKNMTPDFKPLIYTALAGSGGPEIFELSGQYKQLYGLLESKDKTGAIDESIKELQKGAKEFFKNYEMPTDKKVFARLLKEYYDGMPKDLLPQYFKDMVAKYKENFDAYANYVYSKSIFCSEPKVDAFLSKPSFKVLDKDPAYKLGNELSSVMMKVSSKYGKIQSDMGKYDRLFIAGLREMHPEKVFYPDANSTMRLSYGKVENYQGADAVYYDYITHLSGVMEKEDPTNEEFIVPEKLKELYNNKDYGRYGENGQMIVCFLTSHDISGGNSGSPVINGYGELIGMAFDGNWEAMSGDIAYEPRLQRTISVDIRYVLFIIDKFAGAKNLINELKIVEHPITTSENIGVLENTKGEMK
jgi:hypothetical protein